MSRAGSLKLLDLLETAVAGVGGEIQLTDAVDELLKLDGFNTFETGAKFLTVATSRAF